MATTINIIGPSASVTPTATNYQFSATMTWDSTNSYWVATFDSLVADNIVITATGFEDYIIPPYDIQTTMTITMTAVTQTVANLSDGTNTYEIEDSQARADINEIQSNYVTTDTAQTISGEKTIENDIFKQIISGTGGYSIQGRSAKGDTPTARDFAQFKYQDNSGDAGVAHRYGCVDFDVNLDKTTTATLRAYQNVVGSTSFAQINVSIAPDGTITTYAPACSDTNSIVTTTGLSKTTNGYVKLGNGIIIQWGYAQNITAGSAITLPTPFTSAGYSVVASMRYNGATGVTACGVYGETTTKFQISKAASGNAYYRWIAVGY